MNSGKCEHMFYPTSLLEFTPPKVKVGNWRVELANRSFHCMSARHERIRSWRESECCNWRENQETEEAADTLSTVSGPIGSHFL